MFHISNSDEIPPDLNYTYIALILKKSKPDHMIEFHLIALCNMVYKLISIILPDIITAN